MRLIAITMVRNEADILPDFLGHCAALFDQVLAVDHGSTDGTAEMLAAAARAMPLRLWRFDQPAKAQSLVLSALAREAVAQGADWVFPLDADEVPDLPSRAALEARLAGAGPLAAWLWRNLWPGPDAAFAHCRLEGRFETAPSGVRKVALSRALLAGSPRLTIGHGSHAVYPRPDGIEAGDVIGELLHVPVRAAERLRLKVAMNLAANALRPGVQPHHGAQYQRAQAGLAAAPEAAEPALRRRLALGYPHVASPGLLASVQWRDLPTGRRLAGLPAPAGGAEEVLAREARAGWAALPEGPPGRWRLRLEDDAARIVAG
jgi:hypothetical protein